MRRSWLAAAALGACLGSVLLAAPKQAPAPASLLVEGFEQPSGRWQVSVDHNGMGSELAPQPFAPEPGGAPGSPKGCGRIHGRLGSDRPPYSWAQLTLHLKDDRSPMDLRPYKSLRFWAKGDGKRHVVKLMRQAVQDHDHFKLAFTAPREWAQLAIPFSALQQAGWGASLPNEFPDVTDVQFEAGVHDSSFDLSVDQVELSAQEAVLAPEPYDTTGWMPYPGFSPAKRRGTALDASRTLDAPAGKHGWVVPKGEDFVFAKTGKPVRFFGINLVAGCNFPSHAEAESLAEALAEMGVNMTRHHHADAPWATHNFFGKGPTTRKLDPESMDRFDYLIAQLQKRGIYQYFDLLVHRQPLKADGVDDPEGVVNGWKVNGEFEPKLISLQEEFTRQLLGHKNPYTGKAYGKDPAIAGMEVINEDSLWYRGKKGDFSVTAPAYRRSFQEQYNQWLLAKYKSRAALEKAWALETAAHDGLGEGEDPAKGSVEPVWDWSAEENGKLSPARLKDAWAFDRYLMERYFARQQKNVRALGYQGPLTGSNHWIGHPADLALNAKLGYLDRHAYWGHPQGGWDYSPSVTFDPEPLLRHPNAGIAGDFAARRVKGLPLIATEWGSSAPNDFRADGPLTMGVACALQNWSALQFSYSHSDKADFEHYQGALSSFFDVIYQPVWMALWPAVTTMLQRGDIPADTGPGAWVAFSPAELADPAFKGHGSGDAVFAVRSGVSFSPVAGPSPAEARAAATKDGWVQSPGAIVRHNPDKGLLVVAAERSAALAGMLGAEPGLQAGALKATVENDYAVLVLTSLDGKPLAESGRALLVAGGNAVNTGMAKRWGGGAIETAGSAPVLVEPIKAKLSLACNGPRKVWALDSDGARAAEVPADYADGVLRFSLNQGPQALCWELAAP